MASINNKSSDKLIFGTGLSSSKDYQGLLDCCIAAYESGVNWFDTAPSYKTEILLGRVINDIIRQKGIFREQMLVQTKIDPIQMYEGNVRNHVEAALQKMNLEFFDALLIHWPVYKYVRGTWGAMLKLKEQGVVKKVGICNLRINHLKELKSIGIIPEIVQIERHPLNTFKEETDFCKENNILLQAYSPLCKMHPLIKENDNLKKIAENHNCGVGEIVLRWHMQTGAIPIFTSTKSRRIRMYADIAMIELSEDEIQTVSDMNINHKLYLESLICPGF